MDEIINFQIKDFGPINECDMDIGKINIIGGPNASGKSTASKLLYCFLKASCNQRQEFAYESMRDLMRFIINRLNRDLRFDRRMSFQMRDMDFFELLELYEKNKEEYLYSGNISRFVDRDIEHIDNSIELIQHNGDSFYISLLKNLLKIEFFTRNFDGYVSLKENSLINISDLFNIDLDLDESVDDSFKPKNYLNIYDIFYIDSFSIFDLDKLPLRTNRGRNYYDHVDYLRAMLRENEDESIELFDEKRNKNIIEVEEKIKNIIGGKIELKDGKFNFNSKNNPPLRMQDTASGIKQIGVIQLLLSSRKLKEDSFLILDEPEVNLHPEWQFKLAEILVLLVKDLNISLYINTHSPMFIEAMEVFTKYYNLEEDTYYYLTKLDEDSEREGYKFKYVKVKNIYELYDNLSDPYDKIDNYRLKANLKKNDF